MRPSIKRLPIVFEYEQGTETGIHLLMVAVPKEDKLVPLAYPRQWQDVLLSILGQVDLLKLTTEIVVVTEEEE